MAAWALPRRLDDLLQRIPWYAKRRPRHTRAQVLGAIPFRNPLIEWESDSGDEEEPEDGVYSVILRVPRRQDRIGKVLNRLVEGPDHKRVELDELGSEVWLLCDGERNVDGLIRELSRRHKLTRHEVESSLTAFLRTLTKRGFIGLRLGEPVTPGGVTARQRRQKRRQLYQEQGADENE